MSKNDITGDNITSKPSNTYSNNFGELKVCAQCNYKSHYSDNFVIGATPPICNDCYTERYITPSNCKHCE